MTASELFRAENTRQNVARLRTAGSVAHFGRSAVIFFDVCPEIGLHSRLLLGLVALLAREFMVTGCTWQVQKSRFAEIRLFEQMSELGKRGGGEGGGRGGEWAYK